MEFSIMLTGNASLIIEWSIMTKGFSLENIREPGISIPWLSMLK